MIDVDHLIKRKGDEKVVFYKRSHWIIFAGELLLIFALGLLPLGVYAVVANAWPTFIMGTVSRPILVLSGSAFYLMLWLFFITRFIDYYLDVYLVTSERVVDVSQAGLFSRTVSELDLTRIQDVTSEVKGVLRSLMNFGNVYIQTAGEKEHFIFEDVSHPDDIRRKLLELVEEDRKRSGVTAAALDH